MILKVVRLAIGVLFFPVAVYWIWSIGHLIMATALLALALLLINPALLRRVADEAQWRFRRVDEKRKNDWSDGDETD